MANPIIFKFGLRAQYDALQTKDPNALYFLTDSHELYKGTEAIAANSGLYSDIKTVENSDLEVINKYYINNNKTPFIGDVFIVRSHIANEEYAQNVYMFDGQKWESISSVIMIEGDNKSIEVNENNIIALKDYGKRFYKFIEETGSKEDGTFIASHYELVNVDGNNPWIAGLEPRVALEDNNYVIGWYQPNPTTASGVQNQVSAIQGALDGIQTQVNTVEQNLANNYYTKEETYNRDELDNKISGSITGVFHFKGTVESFDALPTENNVSGDVYQIGEHEYAWNGSEWIELGFIVDLSNHITKEEFNVVSNAVNDINNILTAENTGLIAVTSDLDYRLNTIESILNDESTGLVAVTSNLQARIEELENSNNFISVSVNGNILVPNENNILDIIIPTFDGATAGLVPVIAEGLGNKKDFFLNAEGNWTSIKIGDLGAYDTITDYIDAKTAAATPMWSEWDE